MWVYSRTCKMVPFTLKLFTSVSIAACWLGLGYCDTLLTSVERTSITRSAAENTVYLKLVHLRPAVCCKYWKSPSESCEKGDNNWALTMHWLFQSDRPQLPRWSGLAHLDNWSDLWKQQYCLVCLWNRDKPVWGLKRWMKMSLAPDES